MTKTRGVTIFAMIAVACLWTALPAAERPATAPAPKPVPQKLIGQIQAQFERPAGETEEEMLKNFLAQMEKAISLGQQAEKEHPDAPNLHVVRGYMIEAVNFVASQKGDTASRKVLLDICRRLVSSKAPAAAKLAGDFYLTLDKIRPLEGKAPSAEEAGKEIRTFAARYADTDAAVQAKMQATVIARLTENKEVENELVSVLESKHLETPGVRELLKQLGRSTYVGKPFKAELTRLDGTKLTLPDDLKGKVVVVDFWATWCPPCRASMPHMKSVYAKYQPKGVEFVGISLDQSRADLEKYVKDQAISWIITYTGKGWQDPTARHYGISGIPSVWVVGKDGKVASDNARSDLEAQLDKALK